MIGYKEQISKATVIPEFRAIYNPYTRHLIVRYGSVITEHYFEEAEEWCKISFNGDEDHPNYLHIQLDYDECMQLLFYPRADGCESLHESEGSYYYTCEPEKNSENIKIVHNKEQHNRELREFLGANELEFNRLKD
jgi:hypothetical protein